VDRPGNDGVWRTDAVFLAEEEEDYLIAFFNVNQSVRVRWNSINLSLKELSGLIINLVLNYRRKAVDHDSLSLLLPIDDQIIKEFCPGYNTFLLLRIVPLYRYYKIILSILKPA